MKQDWIVWAAILIFAAIVAFAFLGLAGQLGR